MTETPKCPYCGAEMLDGGYTWTCPKCYSNSPVVIWYEEKVKGMTKEEKMAYAREAALHRAEPENRPLTLDEATAIEDPVWLEAMGKVCIAQINLSPGERLAEYKTIGRGYAEYLYCGDYGILWRCWPRKPTPEQMAAEKWEE